MGTLEVALIILVVVWTIIFGVIAAAIIAVFLSIRKAINKANKILEETEDIAKRVDLPSKVVIASILAFLAKNTAGSIKDLISEFLLRKGKRSR